MHRTTAAIALAVALTGSSAWAGTCEPYAHDAWRADMDAVDASLSAMDLDGARQGLAGMQRRTRCLDRIARRDHLARFGPVAVPEIEVANAALGDDAALAGAARWWRAVGRD